MTRDYATAGTEPPLAELLADPLLHAVLRRDRLQPADVWRAIERARAKAAAAEPAPGLATAAHRVGRG